MTLLRDIAHPTGGGVYQIQSMKELLPAMSRLWQSFEQDSPNLTTKGQRFNVDGQVTSAVGLIGPMDMRVKGPPLSASQSKKRSFNLSGINKRITVIKEPPTGKYAYHTSQPEEVDVYSNIDIDTVDAYPLGRSRVYQNEVLPFKIALAAKNDNQEILEKLSGHAIKVNVNIMGACKDSLDLEYTHKHKRAYWYKAKWWADCKPNNIPARIRYIYYIYDNADIDTDYPPDQRGSLRLVPTNYHWQIEKKTPEHLAKFSRSEQMYWVSERISPELVFPLPKGIVDIISTEYFLGVSCNMNVHQFFANFFSKTD